jgi:hypothetical protein
MSMIKSFVTAVISLAIVVFAGSANAAVAVALGSNGVYAYVNEAGSAPSKVKQMATDLCTKKGGVDVRVVASSYSQQHQPSNSTIAVSGQGKSAILGIALSKTTISEANTAALQDCKAKGGTNPRILISFGYNRKGSGTL